MAEQSTAAPSGQDPAPSPNPIVELLGEHTRAITRMTAVLTRMEKRLDALGAPSFREQDEEEPDDEEEDLDNDPEYAHLGDPPRLALRQDGRLLVEVSSDIPDEALVNREVRRFATLVESETTDALQDLEGGFYGVAAVAAGHILKSAKRRTGPTNPVAPTIEAAPAGEANPAEQAPVVAKPIYDPPFAVTSDGRVFVHLRLFANFDTPDRERWHGVLLNEAEVSDVLGGVVDALEQSATELSCRLIRRERRQRGA